MPTVSIPRSVFLLKYRHLVDSTADINFLYGGRDSGKSHFIAQRLIEDCLRLPYFRCLLIKKTYNSIGESQWRTIKDIVEAWGLSSLFTFRTAPLSIECANGNRFLARGCDDPQSIKSVKDPSHAWYEEGNMLTLDDFITVTTTLRTNRAKIQQWFSFNPECDVDYEEFWLYKTFFDGKPQEGIFKWTLKLDEKETVDFTYTTTHSTYHDNPHCTAERKIFLEQLKEIDPYYYQVYTLGKWGNRTIGDPYCITFDKEKHVRPVVLQPRM
ncbi:MAG: PBSX family phage terminase large subunit, partial [Candidatus Doudnabacteria bacterium]|nr:PBSX family phage terminase large subunit [Candidatus Doudnabacteria bacterium]